MSSYETMLAKIEGISVDQSAIGRILDFGTILIRGTGGGTGYFTTIRSPFEFRKKVQEQIEIAQGEKSK